MWTAKKKMYHSQLCYGKYGARICTPVASVVASRFVMIKIVNHSEFDNIHTQKILFPSINRLFTDEKIHEIMIASHRLYEERFSSLNSNLMLLDIQGFFPPCLSHIEVAGVMGETFHPEQKSSFAIDYFRKILAQVSHPTESTVDLCQNLCINIVDKLVLVPLSLLLHVLYDAVNDDTSGQQQHPQRVSLLVTSNDHTVCYLFDSSKSGEIQTKDGPKVYLFDSLEAALCDVTDSTINYTPQIMEIIHKGPDVEDDYVCVASSIVKSDDTPWRKPMIRREQEYSGLILHHEKDSIFFHQLFRI